jgi:hypothetical protein
MTENIDLKELEKKAFIRTHHEDGLLDIFLGIIFFSWGLNIFTLSDFLHFFIMMAGLIAFGITRQRIVKPRLGLVKFGKERKKSTFKVTIILVISAIFGLVMAFLPKLGLISKNVPMIAIILPLNILVIFGLMAYFLDYGRLYWYSILIAASFEVFFLMKEMLKVQSGAYAIILSSLLMISIGIVLFVKFLKKYPLPSMEAKNGLKTT